jgi:hypothetical protein
LPYTPFTIAQFGGLNLVDDPQESGCIDALNVTLDDRGRIKTRNGYSSLVTKTGTLGIVTTDQSIATNLLFFQTSSNTYALNPTSGAQIATSAVGINVAPPVPMLTASATGPVYYFPHQTNGRKYDSASSTFSAAATVAADCAAPQYGDNRLAIGNVTGGFRSRVQFSDPGAPETFGANNYVDLLAHGDGSQIKAMTAWRDLLFVFKENSYYVFYGNSVDSSGNPVFNYRPVSLRVGVPGGPRNVVTAPNGVFFINAQGVWQADGRDVRKISQAIEPLFTDTANAAFQSGAMDATLGPIAASDRYLYVGVNASSTAGSEADLLLVYSFRDGHWMVWNIGAFDGLAVGRTVSSGIYADETVYFSSGATVYQMRPSDTTDAGSAIAWRYRTGFMDLGAPGAEKVVREWLLDGSGSVTVKAAVNDGSLGSGASVTLGTAPAAAQGRDRRSVRGRNVSLELSGSGVASVSRVLANVSAQRTGALKA